MNVIEKAHELGKMLAEGTEFKRLRTADEAQQNDPDAQLLLTAYNKVQQQLAVQARQEDITAEGMQEIRREMGAEFDKLRENANIMAYLSAMEDFNNLMRQVNQAVSSYVSPKDETSCGGDCGGCGGGCH